MTYDGVDDLQLRLRWNDNTIRVGSPSISLPTGIEHSITDTASGYRVELALPLTGINIAPTAGYQFGIDIHVNDDDDGGGQDHKLAWNSVTDETFQNPSLMGTAKLQGIPICYNLNLAHSGSGSDPIGIPTNSTGCADGQYIAGEAISLSATPANGWSISGWSGTSNNSSTTATNTLTMPSGNHDVSIAYEPPPNNAPTAEDDVITVQQDSTNNNIVVLANDFDTDNDVLTITSATIPSDGGTAIINGTTIIYTPAAGFLGVATFSYTISDGSATDTATVTVTVSEIPNANPSAIDDSITVAQDSANNNVTVLENDSDLDDDVLTITSVTIPSDGGTAVINGAIIVYSPAAEFFGVATFSYTISDGRAMGTATVTVTVTETPNVNPTAMDDSASVEQDKLLEGITVLANDTDADGDLLAIETTPIADVTNGMLVLYSNGTYEYTPKQWLYWYG